MIMSVLSISKTRLSELEDAPTLIAHDSDIVKDIVTILTPLEEAINFAQVGCLQSAGCYSMRFRTGSSLKLLQFLQAYCTITCHTEVVYQ